MTTNDNDTGPNETVQTRPDCRICRRAVATGEARLPGPDGPVHEGCATIIGDGWLLECEDCGLESDTVPYIRACPRCGSARTAPKKLLAGHERAQPSRRAGGSCD